MRSTYREPQLSDHHGYIGNSPAYFSTQPPAYQSSLDLAHTDLKDVAIPEALKAGPRRAPFKNRPTITDSVTAFDGGKRPFTNRVQSWDGSSEDGTDIREWLKDESSGSIPLSDRNPFKIV